MKEFVLCSPSSIYRHSTSVSELITTKFGDQWLKETKEAENQERERARLAKLKGYAMTRAAILRTKVNPYF